MIPGWQKCRKHSFETLIFKYVHFDTMIDVTAKKREQRMLYFQYCERVSVQNSNWKENSRVIVNWGIFVQSEDHKRIIPPRMMNYAKIPYKRTIHLPRVSSTISFEESESSNSMTTWTSRGRWIIKFIDDLGNLQSTEFYCPQCRNECWRTKSKTSLCTSLRWKNAL